MCCKSSVVRAVFLRFTDSNHWIFRYTVTYSCQLDTRICLGDLFFSRIAGLDMFCVGL